MSSKNQITLPVEAMRAAGLRAGEEITVRSIGDGELICRPGFQDPPSRGYRNGNLRRGRTRPPARRVEALILDASVLVGLLDSADAHHSRAVNDVECADQTDRPLFAPASSYAEALVAFALADRTRDARDAIAAMGIPNTNTAPTHSSLKNRPPDKTLEPPPLLKSNTHLGPPVRDPGDLAELKYPQLSE